MPSLRPCVGKVVGRYDSSLPRSWNRAAIRLKPRDPARKSVVGFCASSSSNRLWRSARAVAPRFGPFLSENALDSGKPRILTEPSHLFLRTWETMCSYDICRSYHPIPQLRLAGLAGPAPTTLARPRFCQRFHGILPRPGSRAQSHRRPKSGWYPRCGSGYGSRCWCP